MASLVEIYDWFMTGKKPTQPQFWASWGSFWNKGESIPQSSISGLPSVLNAKAEKAQFDAHKTDENAHTGLFEAKEDKTQKGVAGGYVSLDELVKISNEYLTIVNDLVTGGATSLASAETVKTLKTQIDGINTLLTSNDINLDTVQEIVDTIKTVETSLSTILVNDLTTGGTTKALTAEMGKLIELSKLNKYIKSNESLALASRKGDVLYGILDRYTGEQITLSKTTGTPVVDGIIYFQLGSEYFKRDFSYIRPEWFGAVGYDKSVITNTLFNHIINGLIDSTVPIQNAINASFTSGVRSIHFSKLYYTTNQLDINPYTGSGNNWEFGYTVTGNGDNTGIIYKRDDATKSPISINSNTIQISQYIHLSKFAIYMSNSNPAVNKSYAGIYMNECIRTEFEDLLIQGGAYNVENGLITLHSEANNNIFLNTFNRCKLFTTGSKGNGIHYKHETFQPTLQTITNCAIQQLKGCAIVADMLPVGSGGFGGIIMGNELEGNEKGAIALSGISGLTVKQNYYEAGDFSSMNNFYTGLPATPWTFGISSISGSNYATNVTNLIFENNQTGGNSGNIDYALIFCGTMSGGQSQNITIMNNTLSTPNTTKYITQLRDAAGVIIHNNLFTSNGLGTFTFPKLPFVVNDSQYGEIDYKDRSINSKFNIIKQNIEDTTTGGVYNNGTLQMESGYPYPFPLNTTYLPVFIKNEIILLSDLGGFYKCIASGKVHYKTSAVFVSGSADVTCGISTWNWEVGDQVNSKYLTGGTATILNKVGSVFTLSAVANTSITDWLTDCILIPVNDFESSAYVPTLTNSANIDSSSLLNATFLRIGNIVTVNIGFSLTPTAISTNSVLNVSLPIPRKNAMVFDVGSGTLADNAVRVPTIIQTAGNTNEANVYFNPTTTNVHVGSISFSYEI